MGRLNIVGLPVSSQIGLSNLVLYTVEQRLRSKCPLAVTFVNPSCYHYYRYESSYRDALESFDYVLADGVGISWAASMLGKTEVPRISFDRTSIADPVFELAARLKARVAIVGGKPELTKQMIEQVKSIYDVTIVYAHHGYFSNSDQLFEDITEIKADILICGMGVPLQEQFVAGLMLHGWKGIAFTCGGFLDQLMRSDGMGHYYPHWIDRLNLRFIYRLFKEPGRLWKRYLVRYPIFVGALCKQVVSGR